MKAPSETKSTYAKCIQSRVGGMVRACARRAQASGKLWLDRLAGDWRGYPDTNVPISREGVIRGRVPLSSAAPRAVGVTSVPG